MTREGQPKQIAIQPGGSTNGSIDKNDEGFAPVAIGSTNDSSPFKQRIDLASLRTSTMFEARQADAENRDRPYSQWTIPRTRNGNGRAPRAATLFLGKDHERWQQYERERMGNNTGTAGLRVAWRQGTSSTIQIGHSLDLDADSDEDEDDDETDEYELGSDVGDGRTLDSDSIQSTISSGGDSRRNSVRRSSSNRGSKGQNGASRFPRITQHHSRRDSSGTSSSSSSTRPRRFSSNGPEAAFLRHETVIGIHTPRRESLASIASGYERVALAPLSQIRTPSVSSSRQRSTVSSASPKQRSGSFLRESSSREILKKAATAAAASATATGDDTTTQSDELVSDLRTDVEKEPTSVPGVARIRQAHSPRLALKLARRRRPIRVDGTLYDRSGPFREGAVTDGLCVRFFTAEDSSEHAGYESSSHSASALQDDHAVADEEMVPTTYLITTPDNRVSSAAKLRRWAMDGSGRFFAAMEIKSIEAKMRAAETNGSGPVAKSVIKELRERYLDDLLDEVQKAETLNPGRSAVAHVLCTSDNKYLRLEEDYPEEAFFVIAGCDDAELYPVVALVFAQAVRAIIGFHSAGWLHGDIKLENLMFDASGRLVVIDYENANPYRGIGSDGRVTLASYDWIPPEAFPGPHGRRAGPAADLWALGCNVIRAFALRDNVEDVEIREALLGKGQERFLTYRRNVLLQRGLPVGDGVSSRRGSDVGIPGSHTRPLPTAADVDLTPLLEEESDNDNRSYSDASNTADSPILPPSPGPSPRRLLSRFAHEAPDLLRLVLARCISDLPEERSTEAELECLRFVEEMEEEQRRAQAQDGDNEQSTLGIGQRAVRVAIDLSGSSWVRPKLDDARMSLGLE